MTIIVNRDIRFGKALVDEAMLPVDELVYDYDYLWRYYDQLIFLQLDWNTETILQTLVVKKILFK
jgi:hypothetical protein